MTAPQRDFALRFGAALLAGLVLSPVVGLVVSNEPFHRVMTRTFLVALVVAFLLGRGHPRTWWGKLKAMGLQGPDRWRRFAVGALSAIALVVLLLLLSAALGGRVAPDKPYTASLARHLLKAVAMGIGVAFFEEVLCRGYFKDVLGGPLSALLYAGAHFFRPLERTLPAGEGFDPLLGFKRLPELFGHWTIPQNYTLGLLSLFLFGLALNRLRERTGTLYLGIGIHAGLVFAVESYRWILHGTAAGDPWVYGGARLHDGLLGTVMIALLLWAAYRLPLPERLRR